VYLDPFSDGGKIFTILSRPRLLDAQVRSASAARLSFLPSRLQRSVFNEADGCGSILCVPPPLATLTQPSN